MGFHVNTHVEADWEKYETVQRINMNPELSVGPQCRLTDRTWRETVEERPDDY